MFIILYFLQNVHRMKLSKVVYRIIENIHFIFSLIYRFFPSVSICFCVYLAVL